MIVGTGCFFFCRCEIVVHGHIMMDCTLDQGCGEVVDTTARVVVDRSRNRRRSSSC